MHCYVIPEDVRLRLAQSMPIVERRRGDIIKKIQDRMEPLEEHSGEAASVAVMLFDLLVDGGSDIAAFGDLRDLSPVTREHARLGIAGRHYSRFGLALGPALRGALGAAIPPKSASAWCDAFWIVVGKIGRGDRRAGQASMAKIGTVAGLAT